MLPTDLAIFSSAAVSTMPLCIQIRASGLRRLVLMVWEHEVGAAAVHGELEAQQVLGHGGALDVPTRPALPPGARPGGVLAVLAPLPESEVEPVLLEVVGAGLLALIHGV